MGAFYKMRSPGTGKIMRTIWTAIAASASRAAALMRWRRRPDQSRRALAALEDDQLHNLSERGRQIRREERRAQGRPPVK